MAIGHIYRLRYLFRLYIVLALLPAQSYTVERNIYAASLSLLPPPFPSVIIIIIIIITIIQHTLQKKPLSLTHSHTHTENRKTGGARVFVV